MSVIIRKNVDNQTLNDIIEDILYGGLTNQLLAIDGTAAAPAYSFASEPNAGMYLKNTNTIAFSILGADVFEIDSNAITKFVPISLTDGSALLPSYTFTTDTNTGMYSGGGDILGITTGGTDAMRIGNSDITTYRDMVVPNDSQILNTSNDGIVFDGAGNAVRLRTGGFNNLNINSTASSLQSLEVIFKPTTTLDTTFDAVFQVGDGISSFTDLVRIDEAKLDSSIPIYYPDGTAANPSLVFGSDTTTGFYRDGAGRIGYSSAGVQKLSISASTLSSQNLISAPDGTASSLSVRGNTDFDSGIYFAGKTTGIAIDGADRFVVSDSATTSTQPFLSADGSFSAPAYSFSGDTDAGMYYDGGDIAVKMAASGDFKVRDGDEDFVLSFVARGGTGDLYQQFRMCGQEGFDRKFMEWEAWQGGGGIGDMPYIDFFVNTGGVVSQGGTPNETNTFRIGQVGTQVLDGSVSEPSYSFISDTDSGMYLISADNIGIATAGTERVRIDSVGFDLTIPIKAINGSANNPAYGFETYTGNGMYSDDTFKVHLAAAGNTALTLEGGAPSTAELFLTNFQIPNAGNINNGSGEKIEFSTTDIDFQIGSASKLTLDSSWTALTSYIEDSFTVTFAISPTIITTTFYVRLTNGVCTMWWDSFDFSYTGSATLSSVAVVPVAYRPATTGIVLPVRVREGSTIGVGAIEVQPGGTINLYDLSSTSNVFTSRVCLWGSSVTYQV